MVAVMRTPEDAPTDADQLLRLGTIDSVDLPAARCVVKLDNDVLTPPLRWMDASGKIRRWSPPSAGEQVLLLCPAGEIGAGLVLRGVASDAYPPAGNSLTEVIRFSDEAILSYDPEGHALTVNLPANAKITITASGGAEWQGDIRCKGDLSCTGTIRADGDVIAAGISGKSHKHSGVQTGGGISGAPQ